MKREPSSAPHDSYSRSEWSKIGAGPYQLSAEALASLKGINEPMPISEVGEVMGPLCRILDQEMVARPADPFVIAVSGSVAVGKSTFSRVLRALLSKSHRKVDLVATDGFLWPTDVLQQRDLMRKKGFPESYDLSTMLAFLADLKARKSDLRVPVYSHEHYDIIPGEYRTVHQPEILIFEGLNVLQGAHDSAVMASDYFDFSIYLDADPNDVEQWYVDRFSVLQRTVFQRPTSYFHHFKDLNPAETREMGRGIWRSINLPNLLQNIQPTRERADVIMRKGPSHAVEEVLWRQSAAGEGAVAKGALKS